MNVIELKNNVHWVPEIGRGRDSIAACGVKWKTDEVRQGSIEEVTCSRCIKVYDKQR